MGLYGRGGQIGSGNQLDGAEVAPVRAEGIKQPFTPFC